MAKVSKSTVRFVVAIGAATILVGCADDEKTNWYDESKGNQESRDQRVNTFMMQGMAKTQAEQTADFESAWKNTEHQPPVPLEGHDLQNAIERPPPKHE